MKYIKSKSYDAYVKAQTERNKEKINAVWIQDTEIKEIVNYIKDHKFEFHKGVCHGVRNGYEVKQFRALLNCDIIGTEISDTASQFENVIQWDFHNIKDEWIDNIDFIYSNSYDHSYDFEKCLDSWMKCLTSVGRCFLEHSNGHLEPSSGADCFGISKKELIELIEKKYKIEAEIKIKSDRVVLVIKK
jgi:hypothetical protein